MTLTTKNIIALSCCFLGSIIFLLLPWVATATDYPAPAKGCLSKKCHAGIEPTRSFESNMSKQIIKKSKRLGDPNGCVVCHGGNPAETSNKNLAHKGAPKSGNLDVYVPFPGSMWINHKTCGLCHPDHVYAMQRSLMNTEAGKIQGAMWGWGAATGYNHIYGNYDIKDPDGPSMVFGTKTYEKYMQSMMKRFPNIFVSSLKQVPEADVSTMKEKPEQAIFTYIRSDCQRCHVGVRGRAKRGDFRGMGCAACHIPYSNEGMYEGADQSISKKETGHSLVHMIQSTREAKVVVNGKTYSGIPYETCTTCHNRGKRIGVSFQGLMEFPYGTPLSNNALVQIPAIFDLPMDLNQVVTRDGKQLQTVGHHWPASRPLDNKQRNNMERIGICLACHQDIPDGTPAMKKLRKILKKLNRMPSTDQDHKALLQSINRNASDTLDRIHGFPLPHDGFVRSKEQGKGHQGSGVGNRGWENDWNDDHQN